VEQTCEILDHAYQKLGGDLQEWLDNQWVRLASCHPVTRKIFLLAEEGWRPLSIPVPLAVLF